MEVSCVNLIFAAIVTLCLPQGSPAKLCYSCSYTYTSTRIGEECLYAPMNVSTANLVACNSKCYSRAVYTRGSKERRVNSAVRGCWTDGLYEMYKSCTSSLHEETCTRTCYGAKCNTWSLYYIANADGEHNGDDKDPYNEPENENRPNMKSENGNESNKKGGENGSNVNSEEKYEPYPGMINETNYAKETTFPTSSNTTLSSPGPQNCYSVLFMVLTIVLSFIVWV
ncbi:uncharacterized protein LOC106875664 [Octopus bimaculoides]|uniref:Snake toxin/toxin-like domain-containing protein n=1 Tax=Octopus bimaculoides TaxID=37653 RepID=A0A0L8GNY3_OCTBM|nr:uncharacterized protein LOC106875664 [Octopus bimaculoides]|eukprot:XP_014779390.1 PREDICTED: uncharacterized protein LOC106875664 [Octopus bimaculoides]